VFAPANLQADYMSDLGSLWKARHCHGDCLVTFNQFYNRYRSAAVREEPIAGRKCTKGAVMIESIMCFGIAVPLAVVVALVVARVRGRAVRLKVHRLESAIPSPTVENHEQKDISPVALANSIRGLKEHVGQLEGKNDSQLGEFGKKDDAINRLQIELGVLRQQLCTTEQELVLKAAAMEESERALSERESKLVKPMAELGERSALIDAQSVEIIALKTQVDAKATAMQEAERVLSEKGSQLAQVMTDLEERSALVDAQHIEIIALKTQMEANATSVQEVERVLSEKELQLTKLMADLDERSRLLNGQNTEIIVLKTQVDAKTAALQEAKRLLSEKDSQLSKLMADLDERSGLEFAQEIGIIALKTQVQARATAKQVVENALSDTESKLARLIVELDDRSAAADTQRIEIATLKDQIEVLREHVNGVNRELKAVESSRDAERPELKIATEELAQVHREFYNFKCRIADLVQQIVLQTTEERRAQEDLENRFADQSRQINEREFEIEQLRSEIEISHKSEADLRGALDEINVRDGSAIQTLEAEAEKLRAALDRAHGERMRLSYELVNLKHQGNSAA
jgi:chromosome segregation ATPase